MSYYHSTFSPFWGDDDQVTVNDDSFWRLPFNPEWKPSFDGERQRVLCNSDIFDFDPECEPELYNRRMDPLGSGMWSERHEWLNLDSIRQEFFRLIDRHPRIDWILTTKRPGNVRDMWPKPICGYCNSEATCHGTYESKTTFACDTCCGHGCEDGHCDQVSHKRNNVYLGVHIENQTTADARVPELLQCRDLAPVLFGDVVPMGEVDLCLGMCWNCLGEGSVYGNYFSDDGLGPCYDCEGTGEVYPDSQLDWIRASGQTGPNARPSHPDWFRSLRDQCKAAGVPFWFGGFGEWTPFGHGVAPEDWHDESKYPSHQRDGKIWLKFGSEATGRLLDGEEHNGMPEVSR